MAGGNFTVQNKVRPGAYINFKSEGSNSIQAADRGIVALPISLSFGEVKTMILVDAQTNFKKLFGYDILDSQLLLIKEALKRASKVIVYRISSGNKATKTEGTLTVTAKDVGTRGNDITVKIVADTDVEGSFIVTTYLDGLDVDVQQAKTIQELVNNDYVVFSGTGALTQSAGIVLTGGTDTEPTSGDYTEYFEKLQLEEFNTIALPVNDTTIKGATVSFVKRMRDNEGKKIQAVLADYPSADYEGILSVKNGVKLADGTIIDKVKATAFVAGATAGAQVNQSNTYTTYDDAVDTDTKYTNTQIIDALNSGEIVFVPKQDKVVIEQDINTFTSYSLAGSTKGKEFRKNRVIRVLDEVANTVKKTYEDSYIGKADNNENSRLLFKSDIIKYFTTLQDINAIQNFNANNDIEVLVGNELDSVVVNTAIQPVDSMEKLYMTVTLKK